MVKKALLHHRYVPYLDLQNKKKKKKKQENGNKNIGGKKGKEGREVKGQRASCYENTGKEPMPCTHSFNELKMPFHALAMCISPVMVDFQVEATLLFERLQRTLKDQAIMQLTLTSHT